MEKLTSNVENESEHEKCLLLDLPIELFFKICTYLSARTVIKNLSLVCKHLNNIIKNDSSWKHRIFDRWPKQYPAVDCILFLFYHLFNSKSII